MKKIKFKSFSSGSCGNCYFVGLEEDEKMTAGVLIDAGVSPRRLKGFLSEEGLCFDDFSAMLVTHDHLDHIRSLGSYCKHLKKPVYATSVLLDALSHHTFTLDHIGAVKKELCDGEWNEIVPGKIASKHFVVPHDATQTVGFCLNVGGRVMVIMTDLGEVTEEAMDCARGADVVVIESNYDVDMLMAGPYPYDLKMRICQGHGHLSNDKCASAVKSFYHKGLKDVFLCHLSENNNTPRAAYDCTAAILKEIGAEDVRLHALPRRTPSPMFTL